MGLRQCGGDAVIDAIPQMSVPSEALELGCNDEQHSHKSFFFLFQHAGSVDKHVCEPQQFSDIKLLQFINYKENKKHPRGGVEDGLIRTDEHGKDWHRNIKYG